MQLGLIGFGNPTEIGNRTFPGWITMAIAVANEKEWQHTEDFLKATGWTYLPQRGVFYNNTWQIDNSVVVTHCRRVFSNLEGWVSRQV